MNANLLSISDPDLDRRIAPRRVSADWQIGASYFDLVSIDAESKVTLILSAQAVEGDVSSTVDAMQDALRDYATSKEV